MAVVKIVKQTYMKKIDRRNLIYYIMNPEKTEGKYTGAWGTGSGDPGQVIEQMEKVKRAYGKEGGFRGLRHFIVSFEEENVSKEEAYFIAYDIARFYSRKYQICFGVHTDTEHLHIHFVLNTVNYMDGKMFSEGICEMQELKMYVNQVLSKRGIRDDAPPGWLEGFL